ncbi:MAG: ATP-binding cassette domain-containing protein, partial [Bacteriovoracaceae bacterium]
KKIEEALDIVGLPETKSLMPADLSGGMQKRIGLARSIILNPEVILYDEPTAGLDPKNVANVVAIMKIAQKRNIASIFVTHDMAAAMVVCDRILIIGKGKVRFNGAPSEMKESKDPHVLDFFAMEGKSA